MTGSEGESEVDRLLRENPGVVSQVQRVMDLVQHPLDHFVCVVCGVRFGLESREWRFLEQSGDVLFCPRGHRVRLKYEEGS